MTQSSKDSEKLKRTVLGTIHQKTAAGRSTKQVSFSLKYLEVCVQNKNILVEAH